MTAPLLKVEAVLKTFETPQGDLKAVGPLTLSVASGEFVCLVGPSGCGKSTLLQLLGGLLQPGSGQVWFKNAPLTKPPADVSFVFQKPNLMPWRTVQDNVLLPLQVQGTSTEQAHHLAQQALAMVGLEEFAQTHPHALSGGMEQRVALARALIQQPQLLLLDEPFGALDALTRERLNREILRLWTQNNLTAVMVTHNIPEAVFLADRVLVLTPRPARLAAEYHITLPRPRPDGIEYTEQFSTLAYTIRQAITE